MSGGLADTDGPATGTTRSVGMAGRPRQRPGLSLRQRDRSPFHPVSAGAAPGGMAAPPAWQDAAVMDESHRYDVVIVGAGFAGLFMLHRARGLGLSARVVEAGGGVGRDLVLEPVPGRPLRRREPGVLLPVLRRAPAGMGVERALRQPARDPARTSNHVADRFDLRRDIQFDTRVERGRLRRGDRPLGGQHRRRRRACRPSFLVMATGCLSSANIPDFPGLDSFARPHLPHRALAARARRFLRAAGGGHRHRLLGHPVDPGHRRAGRGAGRVPAHRHLLGAGPQPPPRRRGAARDQGRLCRASGRATARCPSPSGRVTRSTTPRRWPPTPRSGTGSTRSAGSRAACPSSARSATCCSTGRPTTRRPSSSARKIRQIVDDPGGGRPPGARPRSSAASGCAWTPATTPPSTGTTSSWSTWASAHRGDHPDRAPRRRPGVRTRLPSSSPPASTP